MKKIFFLSLVLLLFFYSCKKTTTNKIATGNSENLKSFFTKKDNDGSIYRIYFKKIDSKYCIIDSIFLPKKNQTLYLSKKDLFYYTELIETFPIDSYNDYNFDGYNDICIYNNNFKNPEKSKTNFYYLFDKNKYIESLPLEAINISDVCKKNKCLYSVTYKYNDDLTSNRPLDRSDYDYAKLTKYKWINDSIKPIEIIEEKKNEAHKYSIKESNLIEKKERSYSSKKSRVSNFPCE